MFSRWRKKKLRQSALKLRAVAHTAMPSSSKALVENFPDELWPRLHSVVAGYRPIRDEIDPTPLMETFFCEQVRLCLPVVVDDQSPLRFRAWSPGEELARGPFGVEQPDRESKVIEPALVLVPLVAFDTKGYRIGYGGGYYDRTLQALRQTSNVTAVGLAYEVQKVRSVPREKHDQQLDWIITEDQSYRCEP